jgi:hypothetical protein
MEIGKLGVFCSMDAMPASESAAFCRRIERLGYRAGWTTEATGPEPFAQGGYLVNHVCVMPLRSDSVPLPDERLLEALAPH